ncbi:MAG: SDR family NAD(P)-dependent oxidoreductase, partial [Ilumatobacteraceae bacterium]
AEQLRRFAAGEAAPLVASGTRPRGGSARVGFVFSGQGPQWAQMGRELSEREPVFRDTIADIDARFSRLAGWSIAEAIAEPEETTRLNDTEVAQPAIFTVQVALAALWESWGITPEAVVGHSIGELAALHVAGVLTLDDAIRIVWHRGRIMQRATGHGRMVSVGLTPDEAGLLAAEIGPDVSLAVVNSPRSVVLAGTTEAIARAKAELDSRGVSHRDLPVTYAFHSTQMAPFQQELVDAIGDLTAQPATVALYSTVTGGRIDHGDVDADYFGRNVRQAVLFADAVDSMASAGIDVVVELAPHRVLAGSIAECTAARDLVVPIVASMRRGRPERETMLRACAEVYAAGRSPAWEVVTGSPAAPVDLPAYPWQHQRYWLRERPDGAGLRTSSATRSHPLVGAPVDGGPAGTTTFEAGWPSEHLSWVADHVVAGQVVMPGAGLLETARTAGGTAGLTDFVVHQPLLLDASSGVTPRWQTDVTGGASGAEIAIWSGAGQRVATATSGPTPELDPFELAGGLGDWLDDSETVYRGFADLGVRFGPTFRTLTRWRVGDGEAEGVLTLAAPASRSDAPGGIHPTLLDGALQLCVVAATSADGRCPGAVMLPLAVDSYFVDGPAPASVRAQVRVRRHGEAGSLTASVRLFADDGTRVAALDGLRFAPAGAAALAALGRSDSDLYEVGWDAVAAPDAPGDASGAWLVFADHEWGTAIVDGLRAAGGRCLLVRPDAMSATDGTDEWTLARGDVAGLRRIVADDTWRGGDALRGVVHAAALGSRSTVIAGRDDWSVTGTALLIVQSLAGLAAPPTALWFVTQGAQPASGTVAHPQQAGLWGLAAVVACEHPELGSHIVDLDEQASPDDIAGLIGEILAPDGGVRSVARRGGHRLAPRMHRYAVPGRRGSGSDAIPKRARLTAGKTGTLDGLEWTPADVPPPGRGEVRLRVVVAGLNFRDVLLALGMYPGEGALGNECVGVVEALGEGVTSVAVGDVVYGFAPGSLATEVDVRADFVRPCPSSVTVEQAAALPVAYLTAMYGLEQVAAIGPGTRILIHAAAGGVGLAAVQIAQRRGAEVYATAGSPAKREMLRGRGVAHVFDSRSESFAHEVLSATGGAGVDVVLNSLTGPLIDAGVRALADGGWFLELGKRDVWAPERMAETRPDVRYRVYDLGDEAFSGRIALGPMLDDIAAGLADGSLQALPVRAYDFGAAPEAFRWMAQARHVGKLVLRAPLGAGAGTDHLVRADATYWITGGAGALGVQSARWLVRSGARHLVLTGRTEPSDEVRAVLDELVGDGAQVHFRVADASDPVAMTAVGDEIRSGMPPLRGVIHAAGTVDDGLLATQSQDRWDAVLSGKAHGAQILDELTRGVPLDFFVLVSSAGRLLGPVGQGAYPAANAELDALAWARRTAGLPALSVAWGQWAEAGMAARMLAEVGDVWSERGLGWIDPAEGFRQLERLLDDGVTCAAVVPIDWSRFAAHLPVGV